MTTKPAWTDEEKFWRSIREAMLGFIDAVETYKLSKHIKTRTAEVRRSLKSYRRAYIDGGADREVDNRGGM